MDEEIKQVWDEAELATDAIMKLGGDFQGLCESSIANIAALRVLGDDNVDEAVKNS